jgi:hypothetical protein
VRHVHAFFHIRGAIYVAFEFRAVVRCYAIQNKESYAVALDHDRNLEAQDVVLGFEVGSYDAMDFVESGWLRMGRENRVSAEELGDSLGGKGGFGGYVKGRCPEALRGGELCGEKESDEELGFTCAAGFC